MAAEDELFERMRQVFDRVGSTFDRAAKTLDEYNTEVNKGRRSILTLGPALRNMKDAIDDQKETLGKMTKGSREHTETEAKLVRTQKAFNETMDKFVKAQVMDGLGKAIVTGAAAFLTGTRDMAFTAIRGFQSGMDSVAVGSEIFTKEIERNVKMLTSAGSAISGVGDALKGLPGVGGIIAGAANVLGGGMNVATEQIAILNKEGISVLNTELTKTKTGFKEMSSVGSFFTGGMTEMRNAAGQAGLFLEDFVQVGKNASDNLRLFGVNQADALARVGKVTNAMGSQVNAQLRNIGYTQAEISEGTAEYMANLARTGGLAGKSQEQLAKESAGYLTNMKIISSITGEEARAAQKRANDAAMQSAVQAKLAAMGGDATAKFQELIKVMPGMESVISQIMTTGTTTNAAVINSPLFDIIKKAVADVGDASVVQGDILKNVQNQLAAAGPELQETIKKFSAAGVGALFGQNSEFATALQGLVGMLQQSRRTGDDVAGAVQGQASTTDKLTTETTALQQQFEKARIKLQDELTPALGGFAIQLQNTFTNVEKHVEKALNLMIDRKGVANTLRIEDKKPVDDLDMEIEKASKAVSATDSTLKQRLGFDKSNKAYNEAVERLRQLEEAKRLRQQSIDPMSNLDSVPMARGGLVNARPGGVHTLLAEGGMNEAVVPLPGGRSIPVDSPALTELSAVLRTNMNLSPLIEKLAESNQLLRSQLEMHRRLASTIEDGNAINKQILSATR